MLKRALLEKIDREVTAHSADSPGLIQLKLNALEDADVTRALYRASQAGVTIDLIVRGHVPIAAGHRGVIGDDSCDQRRRPVSRAFAHLLLPERRCGGVLHRVGGLHAAQSRKPRGGARTRRGRQSCGRTLGSYSTRSWPISAAPGKMQPDGSYVQRMPVKRKEERSSQRALIEWAEKAPPGKQADCAVGSLGGSPGATSAEGAGHSPQTARRSVGAGGNGRWEPESCVVGCNLRLCGSLRPLTPRGCPGNLFRLAYVLVAGPFFAL